jgi:two-component system OmpR family sensor kinase
MGNKWLLRRIIHNLMMNAIVHGNEGTRVRLSVHNNGHVCTIRVIDSGPGIPGADGLDRAANFANLLTHLRLPSPDPEAMRTVSGHGLGLKGVIRMSHTLGLPMSMVSRPGVGTMFRFKVPLAPPGMWDPDF